MISAFLCAFISTVHASSLRFLGFSGYCLVKPLSTSKVSLFLLLFSFLIQDDQTRQTSS